MELMMFMIAVRSRDSTAAGSGNSLAVYDVAQGTLRGSELTWYPILLIIMTLQIFLCFMQKKCYFHKINCFLKFFNSPTDNLRW